MQVLFYSDSGCSIATQHASEWRRKVASLSPSAPIDVNRLDFELLGLGSSLTNALWCRMDVATELVEGGEERLVAFLNEPQHESERSHS